MAKIIIENYSDDELEKRMNALEDIDNWIDEFKGCGMPDMLHKGPCTRKEFDWEYIGKSWPTY